SGIRVAARARAAPHHRARPARPDSGDDRHRSIARTAALHRGVRPKWKVSKGGGGASLWSADGKTLYYAAGGVMAVDIDTSSKTFTHGTPRRLFPLPALAQQGFDLARDGRFLFIQQPGSGRVIPLHRHPELGGEPQKVGR